MGETQNLSTDLFEYPFTESLVAQSPVEPRDHSKLLVCQAPGRLGSFTEDFDVKDQHFYDIASLLGPGDLLITNDAKVLPVRLRGHRELPEGGIGGTVEALLLRPESNPHEWRALLHMSARVQPGLRLIFQPGLVAECLSTPEERLAHEGEVRLRFSGLVYERLGLEAWLLRHGEIPLPPYIPRKAQDKDLTQYQTVYAQTTGSAAAPTAGFHFTTELLEHLRSQGVQFGALTLHIGIGTFRPMKVATLAEHQMHHETYIVSPELQTQIVQARRDGRRIVAVGTTVVRALESWWQTTKGALTSGIYSTNLFITPGFQFQLVDDLITNFHLPRSTLLVLVAAACGGVTQVQALYRHALTHRYRFYSYGDAMFLRGRKGR